MKPKKQVQAENISAITQEIIDNGTADDAILFMEKLRREATRIDRLLADPRHLWNRITDDKSVG